MRYVVYGAGAVGGTIGGRLAEHGHDVVLIARGAHGEAIRERGLTLRSAEATVVVAAECARRAADVAWKPDDVVVLGMKTQDTGAALDELAAVSPPSIAIVCAQNGVENERLAARRFANVYGMCVMLPATHLEPGVVDVNSSPVSGILDVGRFPRGADDLAARVAGDLETATFSAHADPDIMRRKYRKLLNNLGNSLEAACGPGARRSDILVRARAEAVGCFKAAGIDAASDEEDAARRGGLLNLRPIEGALRGGGSSWQSLARGTGRIETDYLNGEIVLLGRMHGVATPANELLQRLGTRLAREGAPPGSVGVAALEAELVATGR
jgi:2-dehydropantoate 2-reductase